MNLNKICFIWLALCCVLAEAKVQFKTTELEYSVREGQSLSIDLIELLAEFDKSRPIIWLPGGNKPKWFRFDDKEHRLSGSPTGLDAGKFRFPLTVTQFDSEATAYLTLIVYRPVRWLTEKVDFGKQTVGQPFQFELSSYLYNPDRVPVRFTASGLPAWMRNNEEGWISGVPREAHLGPYEGIQITATTKYGEIVIAPAAGVVAQISELPTWTSPTIPLGEVKERQRFEKSLHDLVRNPDGVALTFNFVKAPPAWLMLSEGKLTGTPARVDVGQRSIRVEFIARAGAVDYHEAATLLIDVRRVERAPSWIANPVIAKNAFVDSEYKVELASFVNNPDEVPWAIRATSELPSWASLSSRGVITGTPANDHKGDVKVEVEMVTEIEQELVKVPALVQFSVLSQNHPPKWKSDPIGLPIASAGSAYRQAIGQYAEDSDPGEQLRFEIVTGPAWLVLSPEGVVSGTPREADIGENRARVRVKDGAGTTAEAGLVLRVESASGNHPPVITQGIEFTIKERAVFATSLADPKFVQDADGDPLTFEWLPPSADWAVLSPAGRLELRPRRHHVGAHVVTIRVSDGKSSVEGNVRIQVQSDPRAPVWLEDPVTIEVAEAKSFSVSLSRSVKDLDGMSVTFQAVSIPSWLTLSPNGDLSGAPQKGHVGGHTLKVQASNSHASSEAVVRIVVKPAVAPAAYHLAFLASFSDMDSCNGQKRAIDESILGPMGDAGTERIVLHHRCSSSYQYQARFLLEALDESSELRVKELVSKLQGTWIGGVMVDFRRLSHVDIYRSLSLLKGNHRTYDTGFGGKERFLQVSALRGALDREGSSLSTGGHGVVLEVAKSFFSNKVEELEEKLRAADGHMFRYGTLVVDTRGWGYSFEFTSTDMLIGK